MREQTSNKRSGRNIDEDQVYGQSDAIQESTILNESVSVDQLQQHQEML